MPIIVRGSEIEIKEIEKGVTIQSLLSPQNTGSDNVFLNLMEFEKGSLHNILSFHSSGS